MSKDVVITEKDLGKYQHVRSVKRKRRKHLGRRKQSFVKERLMRKNWWYLHQYNNIYGDKMLCRQVQKCVIYIYIYIPLIKHKLGAI